MIDTLGIGIEMTYRWFFLSFKGAENSSSLHGIAMVNFHGPIKGSLLQEMNRIWCRWFLDMFISSTGSFVERNQSQWSWPWPRRWRQWWIGGWAMGKASVFAYYFGKTATCWATCYLFVSGFWNLQGLFGSEDSQKLSLLNIQPVWLGCFAHPFDSCCFMLKFSDDFVATWEKVFSFLPYWQFRNLLWLA